MYVVHCPSGPTLDCPLVVDPTGVYFRCEGFGGHYVCGASPDKVVVHVFTLLTVLMKVT